MAVNQTGAAFKSLTFDNKTSREFGVYITGEAVYNAPEREVEMISIPGRNGAFALDKGRFENIPVKYPAGVFTDNEADFAQAISDFRNFLCSKKGYCRLTDEYNPNEYRMAIYKSGLEVEVAQRRAGEFEILFDAKPQRWLTSGETAVSVASGGTLTNPTLFDAHPLLEVYGYGAISIGDYSISIQNDTIGMMSLASGIRAIRLAEFDYANYPIEYGDEIYLRDALAQIEYYSGNVEKITSITVAKEGSGMDFDFSYSLYDNDQRAKISFSRASTTYNAQYPTEYSTAYTITVNVEDIQYGNANYETISVRIKRTNTGSGKVLSFGFASAPTFSRNIAGQIKGTTISIPLIEANSTAMSFGNPTYIDCEIGEAYGVVDGAVVPLNRYISLGSKLPTLAAGDTEITFDNTITELNVTPRWWKV